MSEPSMQIFGPRGNRSGQREMTVREYARHERVTERTVWNWLYDKKCVEYRKTPGGGVRIIVSENT